MKVVALHWQRDRSTLRWQRHWQRALSTPRWQRHHSPFVGKDGVALHGQRGRRPSLAEGSQHPSLAEALAEGSQHPSLAEASLPFLDRDATALLMADCSQPHSLAETPQPFRREGWRCPSWPERSSPFIGRGIAAPFVGRGIGRGIPAPFVGRGIAALPRQRCHSPSYGRLLAAPLVGRDTTALSSGRMAWPFMAREVVALHWQRDRSTLRWQRHWQRDLSTPRWQRHRCPSSTEMPQP